ncbi:flavin reductase family protein [Sphingobium sp. JS3065]|uniref:flavin reductase family protein n=1 Tax=Sphingobium sp. JS3065 TaxID=2970925 RepID=UPI0022651BE1|nr:flavin reductase family protein [Sphingobium sp. JS3065]UZW57812.1 flavin reductase family protein [Sphingobium sp. JS3065]
MTNQFDSTDFRNVLGHYPTGVCAITAMDAGMQVGMIVGSFTSVSLDPPLVAFFPSRTSTSWPKIESAGRFCVNVLASDQRDVCRAISSKAANRFADVPHEISESGLLMINGAQAWIDCTLVAVHEAGDHLITVGQVHALAADQSRSPLIFHKGGFKQVVDCH